MLKSTQQNTAFIFGSVLIAILLGIAFVVQTPTPFQYTVFRIILALAAAGVAAMFPGFLNVEVGTAIRATGASAVFVIVYFFSPAALVVESGVPSNPASIPVAANPESARLPSNSTSASEPTTSPRTNPQTTTQPVSDPLNSNNGPPPATSDAPKREMIIEIYLKFRTTGDDKEGGIVTVEFWDKDATPPAKVCDFLIPEEAWPKNSMREFSRTKVDAPLPNRPLEAKLRLTDGKEVNISWTCDVEFQLKTDEERVIAFGKKGIQLDTTGRGRPRSAEDTVPQN